MFDIDEAIQYYQKEGAPGDQQALILLLKEIQENQGGVLSPQAIDTVANAYRVTASFLHAIARRIPSLRLSQAKNRLEMCSGVNCASRGAAGLLAFVQKKYSVQNGQSAKGGFSLHITGCMKNCKHGPNIKWNGTLYAGSTPEALKRIIESGNP